MPLPAPVAGHRGRQHRLFRCFKGCYRIVGRFSCRGFCRGGHGATDRIGGNPGRFGGGPQARAAGTNSTNLRCLGFREQRWAFGSLLDRCQAHQASAFEGLAPAPQRLRVDAESCGDLADLGSTGIDQLGGRQPAKPVLARTPHIGQLPVDEDLATSGVFQQGRTLAHEHSAEVRQYGKGGLGSH